MREVAYSPMMGTYLTFLRNRAIAYDGSYPDENFGARKPSTTPLPPNTTHLPPVNPLLSSA